jgi:hypothetical protein
VDPGHRVLRTGTLKVDQFYSGLALSLLLAPAAIIVRRTAHDLALLQPFKVSSRKPVSLADMDLLMDPGILAMVTLSKYSVISGAVLALLLFAGAFLVPIGTLLITTSDYAAPSISKAVIGIPSIYSGMMDLQIAMKITYSTPYPAMDDLDIILMNTASLFKGELIRQTGVLSNTTDLLGPISTSNITLQEGVTYAGIVTYRLAPGSEYTTEISYTETEDEYQWLVNFTFPDGSVQGDDVLGGAMFMWNDSNTWVNNTSTNTQINIGATPIGGTTYFAVAGTTGKSTPISDPKAQGVVLAGGDVGISSEVQAYFGLGGQYLHMEKWYVDRLLGKSGPEHDGD